MESIRRLHEEILKREYKAEKQRKEEMRYDQMDCLLLAGEEKTERTIPVCETVFPEKFADLNAVREVLLTPEKQVYALIAPAFMGQFGEGVSPGAIRAALKRAGFSGMVEVAVFVLFGFFAYELLLSGLGVHDPQYLRGTGTAYAGGGVSDDRCGQGGEKDASGCCHRVYRSVPCQEKGGEGAGYLRCD